MQSAPTDQSTHLTPPIRGDMASYQLPVLRSFIIQMRANEMWLSQLFDGPKDNTPDGKLVDYPAALKKLAESGEVEILEHRSQTYKQWRGVH
jgi:hypothetical protein